MSLFDYHEDQTDDRKKLSSKVAVNKFLKSKVRPRPLALGSCHCLCRTAVLMISSA